MGVFTLPLNPGQIYPGRYGGLSPALYYNTLLDRFAFLPGAHETTFTPRA